jgi:hypothetical protein
VYAAFFTESRKRFFGSTKLHRKSATATCAAFSKESRMKPANATNLFRKSGVAQRRDLRFALMEKRNPETICP